MKLNKIITVIDKLTGGSITNYYNMNQAIGLVGTDSADEEKYRRMTEASWKDLSPLKYDQMQKLAFLEWQRYPLAYRIIEILVNFCVGDDFKVDARIMKRNLTGNDENTNRLEAQKIWDDFFYDPLNRWREDLAEIITELFLSGEMLIPTTINDVDGSIIVGFIDTTLIKEVHRNKKDMRRIDSVEVQSGDVALNLETYKVINYDIDPNSKTFRKLAGDAFYFQINKVISQSRGHSELVQLLDWIKGLETFLFEAMKGFSVRNVFAWDVEKKGLTKEQLQTESQEQPPRIGSVIKHNENVKWSIHTPDLKAVDSSEAVRLVKNFILGAKGYPEMWFADGGQTNLATAQAMTIPTMRMLKFKQNKIKTIFSFICKYICDQAEIKGKLKLNEDEYVDVIISMYDFDKKDVAVLGSGFVQLVTAVVTARTQNLISKETAKTLVEQYVQHYGVTATPVEEEKKDKKDLEDYENMPNLQDFLKAV
jgi:hypothetical protein